MGISKRIGERIRSLRKSKSMSQEELAEKVDVHYTYIGQVERGEKNLSIGTLEKVLAALDITFDEFFRYMSLNKNNNELSELELLINRIQEKNPKDKEEILTIFHKILDWREI